MEKRIKIFTILIILILSILSLVEYISQDGENINIEYSKIKEINVDKDNTNEYIVYNSDSFSIYNENTKYITVTCKNKINEIWIIDLDSNGLNEILITNNFSISLFDEMFEEKWSLSIDNRILNINPRIIDLNNDKISEIVLFLSESYILVLDGFGNIKWKGYGDENTIFSNIIGDSKIEIISPHDGIYDSRGKIIQNISSKMINDIIKSRFWCIKNIDSDLEKEIIIIKKDLIVFYDNFNIIKTLKFNYRYYKTIIQNESEPCIEPILFFYNSTNIFLLENLNFRNIYNNISNSIISCNFYIISGKEETGKLIIQIKFINYFNIIILDNKRYNINEEMKFFDIDIHVSLVDVDNNGIDDICIINNLKKNITFIDLNANVIVKYHIPINNSLIYNHIEINKNINAVILFTYRGPIFNRTKYAIYINLKYYSIINVTGLNYYECIIFNFNGKINFIFYYIYDNHYRIDIYNNNFFKKGSINIIEPKPDFRIEDNILINKNDIVIITNTVDIIPLESINDQYNIY